jgi:citronellol/citronellal dehydrogenase
MSTLAGKTLFITGASRGIGLAIALRAARDGANVAIAAKSNVPNPKLPGTIHTAAAEVESAGGRALAIKCDIREEAEVRAAVEQCVERFGGIDICVNNASAISLTGTLETPMKRFDLMFGVNVRGTYLTTQACIPHLRKAENPHVLMLSPPLNMSSRWFAPHVAYTMAKYGMSQCVLGMAAEFAPLGIAVNALWPRTVIHTAALAMIPGVDPRRCRKPEIVADAAHAMLVKPSRAYSGRFAIDEDVLRAEGVADFTRYAVDPGQPLLPDLFIDPLQPSDDQETVLARLREIGPPIQQIQGWLDGNAGGVLYQVARFQSPTAVVVELGSWKGRSTAWLAQGLRDRGVGKVFAVDTWRGTETETQHQVLLSGYGPDQLYEEFLDNLRRLGLIDIVAPLRATTLEAAARWPHGRTIGLLHIDASHEYEDVKADFEAWHGFVVPGGFIVFDDVPSWAGPTRFVKELPVEYEFFTTSPNQYWVRKRSA